MMNFFKSKGRITKDLILTPFWQKKYGFFYVGESVPWTIQGEGKYLTENLNKLGLIKAKITTTPFGLKNKIIHFGSLNSFLIFKKWGGVSLKNKIVVTCFHCLPQDPRLKGIKNLKEVVLFHTAAYTTSKKLIKAGIPSERIKVIPLGVDLSLFQPLTSQEKIKIRKKLGLPCDKFIIGSFQKDGVGWGEGNNPKLIKGPDILVEVLNQLPQDKIFVLLAGPARGYVKRRLKEKNIPYQHIYFKDYTKMPRLYNALDLYLITSRVEGGPKQILEAWACGVPVVSTKVGMVRDIAQDNVNALVTEINNEGELIQKIREIMRNKNLRKKLIFNGLEEGQKFSWPKIATRYYQEIYAHL